MSTVPDNTTPADRRAAYDLVHAGIAAGLPVLKSVHLGDDSVWLRLSEGERDGVGRWAAHLGLPAPVLAGSVYMTGLHPASRLPGWMANVSCAADSRTESDR